MNAKAAQRQIASAMVEFYGLLEREKPAKSSLSTARAELSALAAQLDADDHDQAEVLRAVIAADDAIRAMERAAVQAELRLAGAMVALREIRKSEAHEQ